MPGRRILIVEDDAVVAELMASILEHAGYQSEITASPQAVRGTYNLVVADYLAPAYVPGKPWPFLDALRRLSNGAPILGCTGHRDALLDSPSTLGISAVAVKPFDVDDFVEEIERLLAQSSDRAGMVPI